MLTRNKFVYSCSMKIHALGFNEHVESIFCLLLVEEAFSLQKVVEILEESGWWEVMNMADKAKTAQTVQLWSTSCATCGWVKWALSVDQCWLEALQFSVHPINLLSTLLGYNSFPRIQKAVVIRWAADYQTVTMTFFGVTLALGSALELLGPATELVVSSCHINPFFIAHHNLIEKWFLIVA